MPLYVNRIKLLSIESVEFLVRECVAASGVEKCDKITTKPGFVARGFLITEQTCIPIYSQGLPKPAQPAWKFYMYHQTKMSVCLLVSWRDNNLKTEMTSTAKSGKKSGENIYAKEAQSR
jgi:hypothetical protein